MIIYSITVGTSDRSVATKDWVEQKGYANSSIVTESINEISTPMATGILGGGALSINGLDNTKLDIAAGAGIIVDNSVNPPTITPVTWTAQSAVTLTNIVTQDATDIAIDVNGSIVQQTSFTNEELRSLIFLGGVDHSNNVTINNTFNVQIPAYGIGLAVRDLARAIGDINISGNVISANGANIKLNKSTGSTFSFGRNAAVSFNNPHVITQASQTPITFRYVFDNGSGIALFGSPVTDIDSTQYDNGTGTLATVSVNNFTIQRIIMFSNTGSVLVQYGTEQFNKKSDAIAGLAASQWPTLIGIKTAIAIGFLIVKKGTTDLNTTADVEFIEANRFGGIGSSGSASATWGDITGTLSDQTDLQAALDAKANVLTNYTYATLPSAAANSGLHVWITDVGINGGSEWRSDGVDWFPVGGEVIMYNDPTWKLISVTGTIVAGSSSTITQSNSWLGGATGNQPKYVDVYLPTIASTPPVTEGWYTVETVSDTVGTILSAGVGSAPITFTVGLAFTGVATRQTMHTFDLPAGLFARGSKLETDTLLRFAGSTASRTIYMSLGGTTCYSVTYASATYASIPLTLPILADDIDSQTTPDIAEPRDLAFGEIKTSVDMSVAQTYNFDGMKTASGMRMATGGFTVSFIK